MSGMPTARIVLVASAVVFLTAGAASATAQAPAAEAAAAESETAAGIVTIMEIQGSALVSPLEGETVTTRGVVTHETERGGSFWIQDPVGDGDSATSDGLYVYRGESAGNVEPGDYIEITARVDDWVPNASPSSQPLTELVSPRRIRILESDRKLPLPVEVTELPNVWIPDAIRFWEALEGMRVRVRGSIAVSATTRYGEFAVLSPANRIPGSGYHASTGHLVIRRTIDGRIDYNPERIIVDDGSLERTPIVTPGTPVPLLEGVVDYSFGNYKIQPSILEVGPATGAAPAASSENREAGTDGSVAEGEAVRIATFNVENLFDKENNPLKDDQGSTPTPRELLTKLSKLSRTIVEGLGLPEIIVVQEVENEAILRTLGERVTERAADRRGLSPGQPGVGFTAIAYVAVSYESSDGRGIENGFLYDASRVRLVDARRLEGPRVRAAFGPRSVSPGREPIVGVFHIPSVFGEQTITIVGNHFKSKGGDDPLFGVEWPPIRKTEEQRRAQARAVRGFVDQVFAGDPGALLIVAGDFNDFQFAEPGEPPNHPLAILEEGRVPLRNVIQDLPEAQRFTYVYDGNSQVLDHILISPSLEGYLVQTTVMRGNAGSPASLAENPQTRLRSSDHDAVVIRLSRSTAVPSDSGGNQ